ncbi:MAG: hypothetical protein GX289_01160 [Tissierellia bacterium]|jgi:hypothetical protein|nr:hypothetical protein [Tissierellia bacterium]
MNEVNNQRLIDWSINLLPRVIGRGRRNIIRAENAIIENISRDNRTVYVTISYGILGDFNVINMELVRLVVGRDTIITDQLGNPMSIRDLREGMVVDAVFSAAMTRSIPPQARAYRLTVINDNMQSSFTEDIVLEVDLVNGFLYTGIPFDIMSQMRFVVTDSTTIRDRRGRRIRLRDLRPGELVRIEHANFMTMSIPPQTTAYDIQVL